VLYPQDNHGLAATAPAAATHRLRYQPSIGVEAGGPVMWWGDVAPDQRGTDAFSLVYDSAPLEQDVEILGFPHAVLAVAADAKRANWIARLSDVAPDGTVTQVTGAAMNGTHRESPREPKDLVPGESLELGIEMHFTSWTFPKGHRIRLAVNNSQWPMLWPTPEAMTTELRLGSSRLTLPVVPFAQRPVPDFLPPSKHDPEFAGVESLEGREGTVVNGHDPVAPGDDVDRAAGQRRLTTIGLPARRIERLEDQVDVVGMLRQVGPIRGGSQACQHPPLQPDCGSDRLERPGVTLVKVDPEQLPRAEPSRHPRRERDLAVAAVGVVQPGLGTRTAAGRGAQRTDARRTATTIARNAVPYWRTAMARSGRRRRFGSVTAGRIPA
jgi:hypothetical protein